MFYLRDDGESDFSTPKFEKQATRGSNPQSQDRQSSMLPLTPLAYLILMYLLRGSNPGPENQEFSTLPTELRRHNPFYPTLMRIISLQIEGKNV